MENKIIRGYLTRILTKKDSGWAMALFCMEKNAKMQIKIKGAIASMEKKTLYEIQGTLEEHAMYGKSFNVTSFRPATINSPDAVIRFFSSDLFPGVGRKYAKVIVDYFGEDTIATIKLNYEQLYQVQDLPHHLAGIVEKQLKIQAEQNQLQILFYENELKIDIYNHVKTLCESEQEIRHIFENHFFSFAQRLKIRPFNEVDKIAVYFGLNPNAPERIGYWIQKIAIDLAFNSGDTYTTTSLIKSRTMKTLQIDEAEFIQGLAYACENQLVYIIDDKFYASEAWEDEEMIVRSLIEMLNNKTTTPPSIAWEKVLGDLEKAMGEETGIVDFKFDEDQIKAFKIFLENPITLITGGPGTGKTRLIQGIAKLYENVYHNTNFAIATPTGKASARFKKTLHSSIPGTIHKLLEADEKDNFKRNQYNPLTQDLIIIDEFSMVDNRLFAQLLSAKGHLKKIVLVGDYNQLPSVSYGNIFEDLIRSNMFRKVKLNTIHRQKEGNGIIALAKAIETQTIDDFDWNAHPEIETLFDTNVEGMLKNIQVDYQFYLEKANFSAFDYQVIAPIYGGGIGIENLNTFIQASFNKNLVQTKEVYDRNRYRFAKEDKIMYLKNEAALELTNGEMGIIQNLTFEKNKFLEAEVKFDNDRTVFLKTENFNEVSLGYAASVHKTQGSEYNRVVFVLEAGHPSPNFLNQKLIYTAITRAKEKLMIVGDFYTLMQAIKIKARNRKTTIIDKLHKQEI
ncbi:ATP-dependent DNA helicase [Williamsoniiplasma lucivorax]|uniref:Exodeoxyribonuclease V subunit alpha n=1 Tax=Williamsoniiplasma lucivorax TaxID=209274 RepID=A0A2S5RCW1_9MOLU|nr:AAA family ATPase [Williamsoniiplasma lucivorax]PPE05127.1 exodeoxyribonuclease V subunit alpha [Williamsoniiplasma lucivorax]